MSLLRMPATTIAAIFYLILYDKSKIRQFGLLIIFLVSNYVKIYF